MADFPTFQELFRVARDEVLSRNSRLTRDIIERKGSDANAMVAAGVAVGDAIMAQLVCVSGALFLDTAKGDNLDRLAFDRYQLVRKAASPAVGEVEVTTGTPAVLGFDIPVGTPFKSSEGKTYNSTAQAVFPTGSSGPITVAIQSVLTGLDQQASIGTITSMTLGAAPADVAVTNSQATAGADDEETDANLRERAKQFYTTSQRGTLAAIERAALAVPGVRTAFVFESVETDSTPARLVEVVITDSFTQVLAEAAALPGGYQAQADTLALNVRSALLATRAAGIQVLVTIAQIQILGITMLLRYRAGVDVAATTESARAVAVAYTNSLAPGAAFSVSALQALLPTVPGLLVLGGEVVSPSVDQPSGQLQAWRTSADNVVIGSATS